MGLIRSELYCFGIRIQKLIKLYNYCFFRSRTNHIRLKYLIIKKLLLLRYALSFMSKRSFICRGSLINFVVVAVLINCSNSEKYHFRNRACYNLGKNLTLNKILVTNTLGLTNTKWP